MHFVGANVNCSSPIIGSPLHVACADNIPNRQDIMQVNRFEKIRTQFYFLIRLVDVVASRC